MTRAPIPENERCEEMVPDRYREYQCSKRGIHTHEGKRYCGIHHPVNVAKRKADTKRRWAEEDAAYARSRAIRAAREAIAEAALAYCDPECKRSSQLLEQLDGACRHYRDLEKG